MKTFLFTILFGLLSVTLTEGGGQTLYYTGIWDGNNIQINNPQKNNKNKFCIHEIRVNGKKIKTDYKIGGIEFNPSEYGFKEGESLLIEIKSESDCSPNFHSEGFKIQS